MARECHIRKLALSGLSLSYRELDDSRYFKLVDLAAQVCEYDIRVPNGFADIHAFNAALAAELAGMHTAKFAPIDQTLRGGTQTTGALFDHKSSLIEALRDSIDEAVANYLPKLQPNEANSSLIPSEKSFDYVGSWSCALRSDGYHGNHVHPMGRVSSAYYVTVPSAVDDANRQGWLKFGESNYGLGSRDRPERLLKPRAGMLVLFPSYYWHGTLPFSGSDTRMTVAFDVMPGGTSSR